MTMAEPKYRRPLNPEQLAVLQWLYKTRFSTSKQIVNQLQPTPKRIQNRLQRLEEQGYIGKRYEASYKLAGRAAEYFLTPKGARQLPADSVNEWATKSLYKNKTVSQAFIDHCLRVADTMITLQLLYSNTLRLFTKSQLVSYDYFPSWTPDLFLNVRDEGSNSPKHYFLDVWDSTTPFFVSVRKVRHYITYATDGNWPYDYGALPTILAICPDASIQKKLNRQIWRALEERGVENDITFATATRKRLEAIAAGADELWHKVNDDHETIHFRL